MARFNLEETQEYQDIGFPAEQRAQRIIKKAMGVEIIEICNNADYDFRDSNNITYEVKADLSSINTGNFWIEYGQKTIANGNLQPSGISKSKADYHMLSYGDSFYKIKTEDIKYHIFLNLKEKCEHIRKLHWKQESGEECLAVLIRVDVMAAYATIYKFEEWDDEWNAQTTR